MTSDQALKLIDEACSMLSLNRESHAAIQEAVEILRLAINPKETVKK